MADFPMHTASRLVRHLAGPTAVSWRPTADGGIIVSHDDYDQPISQRELSEAALNYPE